MALQERRAHPRSLEVAGTVARSTPGAALGFPDEGKVNLDQNDCAGSMQRPRDPPVMISGRGLRPAEARAMFTDRFLRGRRGAQLHEAERTRLEAAISEVRIVKPRTTLVHAGDLLTQSTLLIDGFLCRYIDDRQGLRQLVAFHVPGDFVDLHGYPLQMLDHGIATLTAATIATAPHEALAAIERDAPEMARKLWFATLIDAAIHRAWLFRLGRLDAVGRVAHFLCETNIRLVLAGLSDGRRFALGLTQNDLAEICGLTNVHVNRVVRALREEGLCLFRASLVEISDAARLAARGQFNPAYLYIDERASQALVTSE
jgi:CRP-like cAMP-binding protein